MKFLNKNKLLITIIVLSIGFLSLIGYSAFKDRMNFLENGIGAAFNPIQKVVYRANNKIKGSVSFIVNFKKVKLENEKLKSINTELESDLIEYNRLKKENERLRAMLNFKKSSVEDYDYIGCDIVGISGNNFLDGFIINKGTNDGIKKRMVAMTAAGLVGQVTEVGTNWAIVQSLANENIAVAGYVERTSESNGMVRGYKDDNNNLLAKIEIPTLESDLKKGDIISTSGVGQIYPKGIKIGEIIEVEIDKGEVRKIGIIKPYVNVNRLEEVFIVIPKEIREVRY